MAHFAELDNKNNVLRVIVIANDKILDSNGVENENIGIAFCKNLFGEERIWKQTSYNGTFRKNYALLGGVYDVNDDAFIDPKPFPSWILDSETFKWKAPVDRPTDPNVWSQWDETTKSWIVYPQT